MARFIQTGVAENQGDLALCFLSMERRRKYMVMFCIDLFLCFASRAAARDSICT